MTHWGAAAMVDIISGQRVGGFLVLRDDEGLRHAVKAGAVLALSDADDAGDATVMHLTGGRVVVVRRSIDEVLAWFT